MTSDSDTGAPPQIDSEGRRRLEAVAAKGWTSPGEHPLASLGGVAVGPLRLLVVIGPKNNVGARYFQLFAVDGRGRLSDDRMVLGMHNTGPYPAFNWVELTHYELGVAFAGVTTDIREGEYDLALFRALSSLVPPGGHLMVEYDSPSHETTARLLSLGFPPVTTPLGCRLFEVGVRSFRDWYIPEGGREGPRKLQGFKPLNAEIEAEKAAALRREVQAVLAAPSQHGELGEMARQNAAAVARDLGAE